MAKFLQGEPTVAPDGGWPESSYRSLEVNDNTPIDVRADLFSWGRVFVLAVTGALPPIGKDAAALQAIEIPPSVRALVEQCVAKGRSNRPGSMADIIGVMNRWRI